MDIGQRPSRQRRHLPLHGKIKNAPSSTTTATLEKTDEINVRNHHGKRKKKERILPKLNKTAATAITETESIINWRQWFWRCCILWIGFLCLRIMISLSHGDLSEMSLTHYILKYAYKYHLL
ncbi:hypothetical protein BJ944DRAFT_274270 [Cunninghamella echinulata]|nr:hypothetical protein BJ944DRAFT_274270 [Cunninghamella echinulata]